MVTLNTGNIVSHISRFELYLVDDILLYLWHLNYQQNRTGMKKESNSHTKDRMIHIRLDDKTHKRLKIKAVKEDTSIQKLVEALILKSFVNSRVRELRDD